MTATSGPPSDAAPETAAPAAAGRPGGHHSPGGAQPGGPIERPDGPTTMAYDPAGRVPRPLLALWAAFAAFAIWYVASRYLPSLRAFLTWAGA